MTFSIWHWVMVLVWFAAPILPIALANEDKTLSRKPYALRTVGVFVALFVVCAIAYLSGDAAGDAISALGGLVFTVCLALWSSHRAQDIGWSKWWCLLLLVPVVALVFWAVLLFKPTPEFEAVAP